MDRILLNLICFVLLTSVILPGLCENCQDTDNCLEFESSRNKCKECKWLYAGDCCEKRDSTITLDTTSDSTVLLNTTDMTKDVNGTGISEGREVPLSSIIASVIGVAVIMATSSVCVVCAVRRAHGNRSFFGNGTESSQRDLISSTQTANTSRSEYSYIDVPDPVSTESHAQNKTGLSDQQVHGGTRPRWNRSVPGGTFVYDTVTDELILIDKLKKSQKMKRKRTMRITEDTSVSSQRHSINDKLNDKNRKRKSSGDYNGRLGTRHGDPHEYDSFNELAKRQKAGVSDDADYSHLETSRSGAGDLYNTFEDLVEDRPNERVSPVFEYAHLSSVFAGKAGSYSYVDVKPKWLSDTGDFAGNYHHMKLHM
ncbi:uncharacterized protein LOC110443009 isoform X2 [Mizuhopecten yessoensis]|uniref:uncharacterized protein LOC110443009 isoform X2 n=1 Tax=Mizuhopecten yessoensis TaxID=6573 RepID=UPI000B45F357|nr:uncharacterized protein LOC110443009 isoform X2 [Mizuhopecten yessoensis]